jgi:hypothetical protein
MNAEQKVRIDAKLDKVISHYNAFRAHHQAGSVSLNKFVYPYKGEGK